MKTRNLKLEGNEKIKFRIEIEFNQAKVTLINGGHETKFTETIAYDSEDKRMGDYLDKVGIICEKLYMIFKTAMEFEEDILKSFEDKYNIELEL